MEEENKSKLYVGNLPYSTTSDQLKETFGKVGEVVEAIVITYKDTGRSKGFGFVTMATSEDAEKAIKEMDGKELDGRPIRVSIARPAEKPVGGAPAEE